MINVCTVSDINYLNKGLVLYESLLTNKDVVFHYLCIDEESYNKLIKHSSDTLKVYNINVFLGSDVTLKNLKESNYKYFSWCLASYFSNKMLENDIESITYIDSDIYFHKNIKNIYVEIGEKEVGIFRHRQFPLNRNTPDGLYNVGIVYFKNTPMGKRVSDWWSDAVLNKKYPQYSTCGDQKYLEFFPTMCPPDCIFIDGNIGHGAPWQWQLYEFKENGNIIWEGKEQELVFTHFSQFQDNGDTYIPSTMHHIYTPLQTYVTNKELKKIYDNYHNELQKVKEKYT